MNIGIKRIYEPAESGDGLRILVDRVWPRGMSKEDAKLDFWDKDIAPSTPLRKWFSHDPAKWEEFKKRYFLELDAMPATVETLRQKTGKGKTTLLYSARNTENNQAAALREYLQNRS